MRPKNITYLLVEDNALDVRAFCRAFAGDDERGKVEVAAHGQEALDKLRGIGQPALERPLMIVLDINMPVMNGHDFLDELRNDPNLADLPVFVFTTSADRTDILRAYSHQVAGYIVKGDYVRELKQAVSFIRCYGEICEQP